MVALLADMVRFLPVAFDARHDRSHAATTDGEARQFAISASLFYLFVYTFMNVGAWGIVVLLRRNGVASEELAEQVCH